MWDLSACFHVHTLERNVVPVKSVAFVNLPSVACARITLVRLTPLRTLIQSHTLKTAFL